MLNDKQFNTLAFISDTEDEQEKQKSEIRKYCSKVGLTTPAENEFISDWQAMKKRLQYEAYKVVVITDLKIISSEPDESFNRIYNLLENRIRVEVINKSQRDMLESYQPENLGVAQLKLLRERISIVIKGMI